MKAIQLAKAGPELKARASGSPVNVLTSVPALKQHGVRTSKKYEVMWGAREQLVSVGVSPECLNLLLTCWFVFSNAWYYYMHDIWSDTLTFRIVIDIYWIQYVLGKM